jgi:hypothetical protein
MKPKSPLSLKEYYTIGLAIKYEIWKFPNGKIIITQNTKVPKFYTPNIDVDAFTFRLHRKGLKLLGFIKNTHSIELYYQPKKIAACHQINNILPL